ncbi:MAG: methyltransferase domain-containing protein [Bacillota bacterium]|nr:methyltransferase domain-containing protein [Bacillota bacterium]
MALIPTLQRPSALHHGGHEAAWKLSSWLGWSTPPAFGLDALPSMVELARENARKAGAPDARFLVGRMEAIPLEDGCVDVVVSN